MSETFRIKVVSSVPDGKLDVEDAMQQVLDTMLLLKSASRFPEDVRWRLESAATNSPLEIVAEPYSRVAEINLASEAADAKRRLAEGVNMLVQGQVPDWMERTARSAAKRVMARTLNGIGTTAFDIDEDDAFEAEITPARAKQAMDALERLDVAAEPMVPAHIAVGEIEGRLASVGMHYGKPALWLRSQVFGIIPCVIPQAEIDRIGGETTLTEVWRNERISVRGRLHYKVGGELERVYADRLEKVERVPIGVDEVLDPDFTAGLQPAEYIDRLRNGDLD